MYWLCCAPLDGTGHVLGVPSLDLKPAVLWALLAGKWGCPDLCTLLPGCKARRQQEGVICCPGATCPGRCVALSCGFSHSASAPELIPICPYCYLSSSHGFSLLLDCFPSLFVKNSLSVCPSRV